MVFQTGEGTAFNEKESEKETAVRFCKWVIADH